MKVVINNCFGGFGLSAKGVLKYAELAGIKVYAYTDDRFGNWEYHKEKSYTRIDNFDSLEKELFIVYWLTVDLGKVAYDLPKSDGWLQVSDLKRDDPNLVKTVKLLGKAANGYCAGLKIVDIPDGTDYVIEEYDGNEHIAEAHKTWG